MGICIAANKKIDNSKQRSRSQPRLDIPVDLSKASIETYKLKRLKRI